MLWKEKGVLKDSNICFFHPSDALCAQYFYMRSCGSFHCEKNYSIQREGNRLPLFFYVVDGYLHLRYQGAAYCAGPDEILLVNGSVPHHYYCSEACRFLFFHYGGPLADAMTDRLISQNGGPLFRLSNAPQIFKAIHEPIVRLCYQEQLSDFDLSILVYTVLCRIQSARDSVSLAAPGHSALVLRAAEYMRQNIERPLSRREIAAALQVSPDYLSHLFSEETGCSLIEYHARLRIDHAKFILSTTDIRIAELADLLGYSSPAAFINAFKARRGISPQKYRSLYNAR